MTTVDDRVVTTRPRAPQPGPVARRFGCAVAASVNALMLCLVNVAPGWDAVPFLTEDTTRVLGAVNASIIVGIVANLLYVVADRPRLRALGDAVTTSVGVYAMVRVWQVFPFDVGHGWVTVLRVLLVVGVVGSGIALVVAAVRLVRPEPRARA
jgi:hypothetical protein